MPADINALGHRRVLVLAIQPFRIEDEARRLPDTNFVVAGRFRPHAVRDGLLITGQQQYSGTAVAQHILQALGH